MTSRFTVFAPVPRRFFLFAMVAYLALRFLLATLPGYVNDLEMYKQWAIGAASHGVARAYETTNIDYPPFFLYVLWGVGKVYLPIAPREVPDHVDDSTLFTTLVKTPHVLFDLMLAGLLYWFIAVARLWGEPRTGPGWGRLAALLYLWNPAVLFGSAYWGQPDGVHSALVAAALACLLRERLAASGALLCAAGLMKPLAGPLVPLLAVVAGVRGRLRGFIRTGLAGVAVAALLFAPFLFTGRAPAVMRRILLDLDAMAYTSVNGHSLWWFLGPWKDANGNFAAGLTAKQIGLLLFGAAAVTLLLRSRRWARPGAVDEQEFGARLMLAAAGLTTSFFFLMTNMHENHLFLAVPLLLAVAGRSRKLAWLAAAASAAVFLNMFLHDLELPYRLPLGLASSSPVADQHLGRPYTWLQLVGSHANALLVAVVSATTWWTACTTDR